MTAKQFRDPVAAERGAGLRAYLEARLPVPGIGSVSALAREAGLRPSTMTAWWGRGSVPDSASLQRLASALGVALSELVAAYDGSGKTGRTWVLTDPELQTMMEGAAERAVRKVLAEREHD